MKEPVAAHGGRLVSLFLDSKERELLLEESTGFESIRLDERQMSDLEMLSVGAYSPLEGFMGQDDYRNVVDQMRLAGGDVWSLPVTLAVDTEAAEGLEIGQQVLLLSDDGRKLAVLELEEKYKYDKVKEAELVYRTTDVRHPGVEAVYKSGDVLLGGRVKMLNRVPHPEFADFRLDPAESRKVFSKKGWKRVVGFQTRNPIHRAHEYIQKCALETVDGLFLHPLVGKTKKDDISAEIRMTCYQVLLENYYPKDRVVLSVLPASMRYAGPREAIFHALVRKNYGCSHFIVGRDHAGVGDYYGSFDAQHIFDEFDLDELGITPLFFDYTFFCKSCAGMASYKSCPHSSDNHMVLSGTKVREMLREGKFPPSEFTRPEVARVLIEGMAAVPERE